MAIRYELNPPRINDTYNSTQIESLCQNIDIKIDFLADYISYIHITDSVMGTRRINPMNMATYLQKKHSQLIFTLSLRARDHTQFSIDEFVRESIKNRIDGILVIKGDQMIKDVGSTITPSQIVHHINQIDYHPKLFLTLPANPDFSKIQKKIDSEPFGFMTQLVDNFDYIKRLVNYLKPLGFHIMPIILFPSEKNRRSAEFLNINMNIYKNRFPEFVQEVHRLTNDVLITSPNDFTAFKEILPNITE